MQKKNGVFTRGLTLQGLLFLAALTLFCILSSCHFYNLPLEDFLKEWTETARIAESSISPEPVYKDSYAHIASGEDTLITYKLINPQNYDLEIEVTFDPSPLGWDSIRTNNYPGFSGPSNQGTVEQDATDKSIIRLTLNKNALASLDGTGTEISPTVSIMEPKSGRNFGSYSIPLRVNSAPAGISSPIILCNAANNTYVICFNMPDMTGIHRDIVSLTVSGFYDGTYTVTAPADSSGNGLTGVTSTYDDTNYTEVTGGGAFVGDKNNRFVGIETGVSLTAVPSPECTITLTDSSGLTSVVTASTEAPPLPAVTASPGSGTIEPGVPVTFSQETAGSAVTLTLSSTEGVSATDQSGNPLTFTGDKVIFTGGVGSGISLTFVKKGTYTVTATAGGISGARDTTTTFTYTVPYSAVYVAGSNNGGDDDTGNGTQSAPFATLDKAMVEIDGEGVVYVTGTVTVTPEYSHSSGNLTLRGYGNSGGTLKNDYGRVLNITGGSVTLGDGITLTGDINISGNQYGGAVYVGGGAFFTMESGSTIADSSVISSSGSDAFGGGVAVMYGGTFTMNDGAKIIGCHAHNGGGGVYVYDSNFTMNGGVIGGRSDNSNVAKWGGGVFVGSGCVVTMNGNSEISYNRAKNTGSTATGIEGGGVHFSAITESTFTMNDNAKIIYNTCDGQGGGVYVGNSDSLFFMNGNAQIKYNQAASTYNGGGVYVDGGTFTVSGIPDITGNTLDDSSPNNVTLTSGKIIAIGAGGLTDAARIGVNTEDTPDATTGIKVTDKPVDNAETIFSSDKVYYVDNKNDGVYLRDIEVTYRVGSGSEIEDSFENAVNVLNSQTSGGTIKLLKDISLAQTAGITGGSQLGFDQDTGGGGSPVTIDLNGHTLSGDGSASVLSVSMGMLEIKDSSANPDGTGGTGKISGGGGAAGGGVCIENNGALRLVSGTITGNTTSDEGGGVYNYGKFIMTGGTISGNTASAGNGGGVYVGNSGTFTVSGTPIITGNGVDGSYNNVYLPGGKTITIGDGGLTGGTIGVTAESITGTSGGAVQITDVKVENAERIFSSDVEGACIVIDNSAVFLSKTIVPETLKVEGGSCTLNDKEVTLSSFWISPYEVTQAEFENVMTGNTNDIESNPSYFQGEENLPANGEVQAKRPVDNVSWYDAIVYCNLLSIKEGLTPCYTIKGSEDPADWGTSPTSNDADWDGVTCDFNADGYRLPTEAEWEYAARGGKTGITDGTWGYKYSGSNTLKDVAWYNDNSDSKTHEVGKKLPNALGLYDMSGNVFEWCWDWYGSEYPSDSKDPTGPDTGEQRIRRSSAWNSWNTGGTVSGRNMIYPYARYNYYGFRLVRSAR